MFFLASFLAGITAERDEYIDLLSITAERDEYIDLLSITASHCTAERDGKLSLAGRHG